MIFLLYLLLFQKILPDASIDVRDNINRTETEVDRVEIIPPNEHPRQFKSHTPKSLDGSGTTSRETLLKVISKIL